MSAERPSPALFESIVGQDDAVAALKAAAGNPVHAYLFRGAEGNGGLAAAHGFAAALLCPTGGCGVCATCRGALSGTDPDLHIVRRSGASLSKDTMRQVVALAQRRPLAAARQVIVVLEMHLVLDRAPVLLKTLEEPPGQTVFILLADELTPDLTTIASRRWASWRSPNSPDQTMRYPLGSLILFAMRACASATVLPRSRPRTLNLIGIKRSVLS